MLRVSFWVDLRRRKEADFDHFAMSRALAKTSSASMAWTSPRSYSARRRSISASQAHGTQRRDAATCPHKGAVRQVLPTRPRRGVRECGRVLASRFRRPRDARSGASARSERPAAGSRSRRRTSEWLTQTRERHWVAATQAIEPVCASKQRPSIDRGYLFSLVAQSAMFMKLSASSSSPRDVA